VGATLLVRPTVANDLRFNYSTVNADGYTLLDNFGGAVPLTSPPFPSPHTVADSLFVFHIFSLSAGSLQPGFGVSNSQKQLNLVDNLSIQSGSHSLKFGVDFRRLTPVFKPQAYIQDVGFLDVPSAETGGLFFDYIASSRKASLLFRNLGAFAQDTWRVRSHLTLTMGLRWDLDFTPSTTHGPSLPAAINFSDPASLGLAPSGTPAFRTTYGNVAPRVGLAYELRQTPNWQTLLRTGFGIFFDLATQEVGNNFNYSYPFGASRFDCCFAGTFPVDATTAGRRRSLPPA
jgi:outer membrane receptor protein involved in Fe transport